MKQNPVFTFRRFHMEIGDESVQEFSAYDVTTAERIAQDTAVSMGVPVSLYAGQMRSGVHPIVTYDRDGEEVRIRCSYRSSGSS